MSTITMTTGEARTVKFTASQTNGVWAVTAELVDVAYNDLTALAEVTPATGLAKYDLSAKVYRQGTPGTTITTYATGDFKELATQSFIRSSGIVLLPLTAPTAPGVYVVQLGGVYGLHDVWKDASTVLVVKRGAA